MGNLAGIALFDGDFPAVGQRKVEGAGRRGDVEGYLVHGGQLRHAVGADFVGHVAVGGDPIGAGHHRLHSPLPHHYRGHRIADQGDLDPALLKLPGSQPGAL